jgi:hypothetical protein
MAWNTAILAVLIGTPVAGGVNVREACRQDLGGAYLKVYDERSRAADYAEMLADSLARTRAALVEADKDAAAKREAAKRGGYDLDKAVARDHAEARLLALKSQESENARLLDEAKASHAVHEKEEKRLRAALSHVFDFDRHEDQRDGGYPLRLKYKADCPKYRYLCTLPERDVEQLLLIRVDGKLPESCSRYAGLSKLR